VRVVLHEVGLRQGREVLDDELLVDRGRRRQQHPWQWIAAEHVERAGQVLQAAQLLQSGLRRAQFDQGEAGVGVQLLHQRRGLLGAGLRQQEHRDLARVAQAPGEAADLVEHQQQA
jgi:nucleoid-associated protein YgaU